MKGIAVAYIPYRKTMQILQNSFNATPEELAVWIFAGKKNGGIDAYANANELDPPPRFYFNSLRQDATGTGYLSEIKAAWFDEDEVAKLHDQERYITAPVLVERWREMLGEDPDGDILAKISESRLNPIHPVTGLTQWDGAGNDVIGLAPRDTALFALSEVLAIEREDFGTNTAIAAKGKAWTVAAHSGEDSTSLDTANLVYWRVVLYSLIKKIDGHKKASVREVIKYLRELQDKRLPNKGSIDVLVWINDIGDEKTVQKKTVSTAISTARKLP